MYVSRKLGIVYVAPPKTATRSVAKWLQLVTDDLRKTGGHHGIVPSSDEFRWMITVRNPYRRMLSWVDHLRSTAVREPNAVIHDIPAAVWRELSFDQLLHYGPLQPLLDPDIEAEKKKVLNPPFYFRQMPRVDHVIKVERLDDMLHEVVPGFDDVSIPRTGQSGWRVRSPLEWWEEFTPRAIETTRRFARADFDSLQGVYTDDFDDAVLEDNK